MLQAKVLVLELVAVDGLATSAVVVGEVATLAHEVGDHTVEGGALVTETFLSGAKGTEILSRLGHDISPQLEFIKSETFFQLFFETQIQGKT